MIETLDSKELSQIFVLSIMSLLSILYQPIHRYICYLKRKHGNDYNEMNNKMEQLGVSVGIRLYEVVSLRERNKRETKLVEQLRFIQGIFWKHLFGKQAESIERLKDRPNDYLIRDENPLLLKYISEEGHISPAQFMCGILKGVLNSSGFTCTVTYQFKTDERGQSYYPHTVFILSFDEAKDL